MIEDDFYATIKFKSGEEVYAKVAASEEDTRTMLLVSNPITIVEVKTRAGVAGYKVITPLKIKNSGDMILVDRGWIKRSKFREDIPNISIPENNVIVSGVLELPELGLVLSDDLVTKEWPKTSQTKSSSVLLKEYDEGTYELILLADPLLENSLEYIKITPTNMTPSKHYGYSAQWFLMFFVLCLMYVWYGYKRNEK